MGQFSSNCWWFIPSQRETQIPNSVVGFYAAKRNQKADLRYYDALQIRFVLYTSVHAHYKQQIQQSALYITNKEALVVYYTVIKHDGHLRTRGKYGKHVPQGSVFYISQVFSIVRSALSQCSTRLRLPSSLASWYRFYTGKTIKHAFSMFYTLIKHGFLTN